MGVGAYCPLLLCEGREMYLRREGAEVLNPEVEFRICIKKCLFIYNKISYFIF